MNRIRKYMLSALLLGTLLSGTGCSTEMEDLSASLEQTQEGNKSIPEGYFEVNFSSGNTNLKSAVSGSDARIQYLRYIIYKSTGEYVKEKQVWTPVQGTPGWPLSTLKDTLPKGSYKAVFLGNTEKNLFPYGSGSYADVLTNYKTQYSNARIILPNAEFSANTEYYWANVAFSNATPNPSVLLQRIIGCADLHRNFVDAQHALDTLLYNIATVQGYRNTIRNNVNTQLTSKLGLLGTALTLLLATVNTTLNQLIGALVEPVTTALYNLVLANITNQVGQALTGNANQAGALAGLGALLNPWNSTDAVSAIVTMNNFPKSVDFDLNVKEKFPNGTKFKYNFTNTSVYAEKDVFIKGFGERWSIQRINVVKSGLVSGVIVDGVIDSWLLSGTFVDINDSLSLTVPTNRRYKDNYSFLDLKVSPAASNRTISVSVSLNQIANLDDALKKSLPALGTIISSLLSLIGTVTIEITGLQVPILSGTNLILTGSWDQPTAY